MAALAIALAAAGVTASTASGAPAELIGAPRQVYANGGETYLVDAPRGTVQWLDHGTMAPRGAPVELGGPIGDPVVDPAGILWATVGESGYVTGVFRDRRARPFKVSGEGRPLQLILMSGRLVAFAIDEWTVYNLDQSGVRSKRVVPAEDRDNFATKVSLPAWTEGPLLPMLSTRRFIVFDVDQGWAWSQEHGLKDDFPQPNSIGRFVVLVYEVQGYSQRINFADPKNPQMVEEGRKLAGTSGHRTVLARNGALFVDELHNPKPR